MKYHADFHLHSCLSPCGDLEMDPASIVQRACDVGLNAIALTDHNSARNCPAFAEWCQRLNMPYLLGMEVSTQEELHVLCLFDTLDAVMALDQVIYDHLPDVMNDAGRFGDQVVVNAANEIEDMLDKYLISSIDIPMDDLLLMVHERGGIFIPAHVDRPRFSITSQLGFVPTADYDAIEVTYHYDQQADPLDLKNRYPLLTNSDSHYLDQIGETFSELELSACSIDALRAYFKHTFSILKGAST